MYIHTVGIQKYAEQISAVEPDLLNRLRKETERLPGSKMLSSTWQGRILALFSQLLRPKNVVEIGTYTGYGTLCLAEGLAEDGVLHTIDKSNEAVAMAKRYVAEAGQSNKVHFYVGNALNLLPKLQGPFDLVFIDADKRNYARYYDLVIPHVRSGGLVVADNVFWHGKVLDEASLGQDARTKALVEFAQRLQYDKRIEQVCLPVRDGLLVARRL